MFLDGSPGFFLVQITAKKDSSFETLESVASFVDVLKNMLSCSSFVRCCGGFKTFHVKRL